MLCTHSTLTFMILCIGVLLGTRAASTAVLYEETFDDTTLEAGTTLREATVSGGVADFNDDNTGGKAGVIVGQSFTSPLMTFSFDIVAPVTQPEGVNNELLLRAGHNTNTDMLTSSQFILELILFRNGANRGGFLNNGNETAFIVANNSASAVNFTSPVDGSTMTLDPLQYAGYIRDNVTGDFVQAKAPTAFVTTVNGGVISKFGVGNASNALLGTFSLDNVRVVDEISFGSVPEPASLALVAGGALLLVSGRKRRGASRRLDRFGRSPASPADRCLT